MDAGYAAYTDLHPANTELGMSYGTSFLGNTTVWSQGQGPLPLKARSGRGWRPTRLRRDAEHQPVDVKSLALGLSADVWQTVTWREGSTIDMTSRFARVRVRPAHRDTQRDEPRPEKWLLIEWPEDAPEPIKYWYSTLAADVSLVDMVDLTKLRWRIERAYQDLKQEVGLGHYEGRGWRGFHHHATLCIAAYGFLISERETISPSGPDTARTPISDQEALPVRPERHVSNSIATMRQRLTAALARSLLRCDDPEPRGRRGLRFETEAAMVRGQLLRAVRSLTAAYRTGSDAER